jgi:hypothetical protein
MVTMGTTLTLILQQQQQQQQINAASLRNPIENANQENLCYRSNDVDTQM